MRWSHPARAAALVASLATLPLASACGRDALAPQAGGISVLFIGNTYSAINDLPGVVQALLDSVGPRPNHTFGEIMLGLALEDHWFLGIGQEWINKGGWDYVILQQGPSTSSGKASLLKYTQLFAPVIRDTGAQPGLWEIWPIPESSNAFDAIYASYKAAADSIGGFLIPAADTWQEAWKLDPSLAFYEADQSTASPLGTYAIGLTIASGLTHKDPELFPEALSTDGGITITVDHRSATLVKYAVQRVLATR